jgi:hypothetical protein
VLSTVVVRVGRAEDEIDTTSEVDEEANEGILETMDA